MYKIFSAWSTFIGNTLPCATYNDFANNYNHHQFTQHHHTITVTKVIKKKSSAHDQLNSNSKVPLYYKHGSYNVHKIKTPVSITQNKV